MTDLPALLEREAQAELRQALSNSSFPARVLKLDAEALAALALLGRRPTPLRTAALAIMPHTPRLALHGAGVIDFQEGHRPRWVLTTMGQEVALTLAAATPQPSEEDRQRAKDDLAALLAEVDEELGLNESPERDSQSPENPGRDTDAKSRRLLRRR